MSALTDVFTAIANAIRGKNGLSTTYKPNQMAQAITDIPSGGGSKLYAWRTGSVISSSNFAYTLSEDPKVGDNTINGWNSSSSYKTAQYQAIVRRVKNSSQNCFYFSPAGGIAYNRDSSYDITMIT